MLSMLEASAYRRCIENRIRAGNTVLPWLEGMSYGQPAPRTGRRARSMILAVLVVVAALVGVLGYRSLAGSSSAAPIVAEPSTHRPQDSLRGDRPGDLPGQPQGDRDGSLGVADGEVPDGVTVFDDAYPAVANLDPALLGALRQAATDAARDWVEFFVNSGWRSRKYQEHLLDEAVSKYGSRAEAARWVATPDTSPHVSGDAVDIGHSNATAWLSEHGAEYGLCQIYRNEPWHYELRPEATSRGCPPMYADPTHDPRMQQ
jgi:zinc D-Ala-D-Ala carboxypeptidase